jgi:hypothetical protein
VIGPDSFMEVTDVMPKSPTQKELSGFSQL